MSSQIFHPDFKARPFWWEAYAPEPLAPIDLPREVPVAIVGAGYAGLSAALALNQAGTDCLILDANEPGFGASTRNGGMVSGGVNVGKRYLAKPMPPEMAAPRSVMMSPIMLPVTATSNHSGFFTIHMQAASMYA